MSDKTKTKRSFTDRIFCLLIWGVLTVSLFLGLWPSFVDSFAGIRQSTRIGTYEDEINMALPEDIEAERRKAEEYNRKIAERQKKTPLVYRGAAYTDEEYESILALGADKVMCYVDIPKIHVSLPVAHGTSSSVLEYELGHMYGSSIPIGGADTHAIITGHTGFSTAKLLTDLTQMEEGDFFYISILGEKHRYQVSEINIVYPEEDAKYMQIEEGQDLVTLYTCTPYVINDHRLLVKGKRTLPDPEPEESGPTSVVTFNRNIRALIRTILIAAIPITTACIGLWRGLRTPHKKKKTTGTGTKNKKKGAKKG